ncbi:hypothetical protein E2K80_01230 [Rhodophyticola sp. CCM32]|uniref:hypothetical protein n=1 Tax=Rhodophyticola sp. CCM32 TaxID=2916397 RepID=UPI00107F03FF|nr:hypothetical protein [Rhodophyticola sp. CCM32]QBX99517.1 hypothetical protein E2K80_01230 [Rhodophyticola sp. CCM32]
MDSDYQIGRDDWLEVHMLVAALAGLCIVLGMAIAEFVSDVTPPDMPDPTVLHAPSVWISG